MQYRLVILFWLTRSVAIGQPVSTDSLKYVFEEPTHTITPYRTPILSGGSLDFVQTGQVNASTRVFKLYVGEPGKFRVPVSLYTGISANQFSTGGINNEDNAFAIISPAAGLFNIHIDGIEKITGNTNITSLQANYELGVRWLNFYSETSAKNIAFFNLITGAGLTFITGAWENNGENSPGIFWLNAQGLYGYSPPSTLKMFFPVPFAHHLLGCSGGMGIELSKVLNIKVFYYRFLNNGSINAFRRSFLQLSFNYSSR